MVSSFHTVLEGKFDWDMKLALPAALGAITMILLIANAATHLGESVHHIGLTQRLIASFS